MEILIPITFFLLIAAIVIGPGYLKSRERMKMQDNLRLAIEKGQPLPPEVIEAVARASDVMPTRTRDVRRATILMAVAASFSTMGLLAYQYSSNAEANAAPVLWGIATIPGFIGLAYLALALVNKNKN
jgi:hypothetical protein